MACGIEQRPCKGYERMLRALFFFSALIFLLSAVLSFRFFSPVVGIALAILCAAAILLAVLLPPACRKSLAYARYRGRLVIRGGVLFQKTIILPRARLQCVTIRQSPPERLFGICTMILSCSGGKFRLYGIEPEEAKRLRGLLEGESAP